MRLIRMRCGLILLAARSEALALRSTAGTVFPGAGLAGRVLSGAGLGIGTGVISGKRLAAFPAPMTVVLVTFWSGMGPGMAARGTAGKRLAAFPGPVSVLVALPGFGKGPGGEMLAGGVGEADGLADAERVGLALAVGDTERVGCWRTAQKGGNLLSPGRLSSPGGARETCEPPASAACADGRVAM